MRRPFSDHSLALWGPLSDGAGLFLQHRVHKRFTALKRRGLLRPPGIGGTGPVGTDGGRPLERNNAVWDKVGAS